MSSTSPSLVWNSVARDLIKRELNEKNLGAQELKSKLEQIGIKESSASISNKLSRGTFSARFLIQCLHVLESDSLNLPDDSISAMLENTQLKVEEPSIAYGNAIANWRSYGEFSHNSFDHEWYVDTKNTPIRNLVGGKVISLFTGAGGLDIGLESAGFETVGCIEIDDDCKETLRRNRPKWKLIEGADSGDVRKVSINDILKSTDLKVGEAAIVTGGAPCQPFSNIGKKGGVTDVSNGGDLFQEFVRVVTGIKPKAFIFENVVGITQNKHSEVLSYMKSCLNNSGYSITYKVLNAADYGVPQKRNRFILVGLRGDQVPALPKPTHFKSREVYDEFCFQLGEKPKSKVMKWKTVKNAFSKINGWADSRPDNVVMNISDVVRKRMELIGPGENFHVLPMDMRPNCWKSGKHQGQDTFGRLKLDEPSVTIRTAAYNPAKGRYIHPTENRGLNSMELASLQGFPSNWHFFSSRYDRITLNSVGRQIGNAVPPPLAEALGKALNIQLTRLAQDGV